MDKLSVVISKSEIEKRVREIGSMLTLDYAGKDLLIVGVLNGAFIFLADLVRSIDVAHEIDFIRVSSYGDDTSSSGIIRLSKDTEISVEDKHVLLVEDIIDTGTTLAWLTEHFAQKKAASVRICTLISKLERRESAIPVDYHGFSVEYGFLVGYGLDYAEKYRHLPEVCSVNP